MLWCTTTPLLIGLQLSIALFGKESDAGHAVQFYQQER